MKKRIKTARTFMPFDGGLSPLTDKSVIPTNNVHTIEDVLNGKAYKIPGAGGNWGADWNKRWDDSVEGHYKPSGDRYKAVEEQKSRDNLIKRKMLSNPETISDGWEVKVDGALIKFRTFDEANEYSKKVKPKYIRKIKMAQEGTDINKYVQKTYMIESFDVGNNVKETGSAFAISRNRLITCAHVVKRYDKNNIEGLNPEFLNKNLIINIFAMNRKRRLKVIKIDWEKDIALLETDFDMASFFELDFDISVGSNIIAIGSPHGFENNASFGRVGSLGRNIYMHQGAPTYFTIDAPIFSGNSGGPVISESTGKVCGMVTAVVAGDSSYGLNMAIGSDYISNFLKGN